MKLHVQIVLLLFTTVSIFMADTNSVGLSNEVSLTILDDYNKPVSVYYNLINTKLDRSESNYPNTVKFYLYKKENANNSVQLYIGDEDSLKIGGFDSKIPTVLITHGWMNNYKSPACTYIRDAYLQQGDYNIILIDWGDLAKDDEKTVGGRAESVAKYVSKMLDFLMSQGMDPSNTTIVGHSFGAHVAGLASYYAKTVLNIVIGLDPAGPNFHTKSVGGRLSKEDGNCVHAIHTTSVLGLKDAVGHADFYPNGAIDQPGCVIPQTCGHIRSYEYFAESIYNNKFRARKCSSYTKYKVGLCNLHETTLMGGAKPDCNAQGKYYLDTNFNPPFAKN